MENAFKQILLPFDGSSQAIVALKSALFFAKKYNSKLCVIHIDEGISNNDIKAIINQNCDGFDYQFLHKSGRPYNGIIDANIVFFCFLNNFFLIYSTFLVSRFK